MYSLNYFNQTQDWVNFWIQSNNQEHQIYYFEDENLGAYVYEYPLFFNKKFWYIPRGFIIKNQELSKLLSGDTHQQLLESAANQNIDYISKFLLTIEAKAKTKDNIAFIKTDINESILKGLSKENRSSSKSILKLLRQPKPQVNLRLSGKKLQYLETRLLDLEGISNDLPINKLISENIGDFWGENQKWFVINLDKRTRYGTRKALESTWKISKAKSNENFEAFFGLHQDTSQRHSFGIHSREYLKNLFKMPFSKIIVLRDQEEVPQAAWFGITSGDSLIHLYGGNSQYSRDNFGQYLLHLVAIYLAVENNCNYYDLGGLEEGKGFDMFKQGYRGIDLKFFGPFDIVRDRLAYTAYNLGRFIKGFRK